MENQITQSIKQNEDKNIFNPIEKKNRGDAEMTIGNRITKLRFKNCMSLRDFGNVLGVTDTTVLRWENNDTRIAFEDAIKMCKRFRVSLNWLAGLED